MVSFRAARPGRYSKFVFDINVNLSDWFGAQF